MSEEEKRCCEPQSIFFCEPHLPPDAPPPPPPGGGAPTALSAASRRDYERAYADASRGPPTADELLRLADHGPAADHGADAAREMRYHDAAGDLSGMKLRPSLLSGTRIGSSASRPRATSA